MPDQTRPPQPPPTEPAEWALRELRSLWLVPALLLSALAVLLFVLSRALFPLVSLSVFVVVCVYVHRRAARLADTLRQQAAQKHDRIGPQEQKRHAAELEHLALQANRCARESEVILASLNDAVVLFNAAGQLVSANRAAQTILDADAIHPGESITEWATHNSLCYPSGQPVPPGVVPLTRTLRDGIATEREEFLVAMGRTVEINSAPVLSPEGTQCLGAVVVLRDMTELRRSQQVEVAAQTRQTTLLDITRRLSAPLSADEIHAVTVEGALALLPPGTAEARALLCGLADDGKHVVLRAMSPDGRPKRPRTRQQADPPMWAFDAKSPLLWPLYVSRQSVVSGDVASDARFQGETERSLLTGTLTETFPVTSALALPLVAGKKVDGHLLIACHQPDAFADPRLQDAYAALASLAAIARARASLDSDTRRQADELDALWTVSQAAAIQSSISDLADALTERIRTVFAGELCTLSLWETTPTGERHLSTQGTSVEDASVPGATDCADCDGITRRAAVRGETVVRSGIANPPFGACRWRAFAGQSGTHSVLAVPLVQAGEILGALTVYRSGNKPFPPNQIRLLQTLATLAAAAVQDAHAFTGRIGLSDAPAGKQVAQASEAVGGAGT